MYAKYGQYQDCVKLPKFDCVSCLVEKGMNNLSLQKVMCGYETPQIELSKGYSDTSFLADPYKAIRDAMCESYPSLCATTGTTAKKDNTWLYLIGGGMALVLVMGLYNMGGR
jgi:hypothetical protein